MDVVLLPVFALIAAGLLAARTRLFAANAIPALSDLAFHLLVPAMLFRAMARTDFTSIDLGAPTAYFAVVLPLFGVLVALARMRGDGWRRSGVLALGCTYSNLVMLGLPLVRIALGERALAIFLTIVSLHSLLLLTLATVVVELGAAPGERTGRLASLRSVVRSAVLHPVILPIVAGIVWSVLGLRLPAAVDATLAFAAGAASPLCLILLGASLAQLDLRSELRPALGITLVKNIVQPSLAWLAGAWLFGLDPVTLTVVTLAASLPTGVNVYLFAQRYAVAAPQVSAGVLLSTVASALALGPLLAALGQ